LSSLFASDMHMTSVSTAIGVVILSVATAVSDHSTAYCFRQLVRYYLNSLMTLFFLVSLRSMSSVSFVCSFLSLCPTLLLPFRSLLLLLLCTFPLPFHDPRGRMEGLLFFQLQFSIIMSSHPCMRFVSVFVCNLINYP